jgi:hypothetical protein
MAIQVSGTEVISNARALTNVASIDATTAAAITAGGVGGGGSRTFTASGSITAGQPVGIVSTNTVAQITSGIWGTPAYVDASINGYQVCFAYDSVNQKVAAFWLDSDNQQTLYAKIGTMSTSGVVTWGSLSTIGTISNYVETGNMMAAFTSSGNLVIAYSDVNQRALFGRVATISGTTLSWGSTTTIINPYPTTNIFYISFAWNAYHQKIVAFYNYSSSNLYSSVAGVSGTTITAGARQGPHGTGYAYNSASAGNTSNGQHLVVYSDNGLSNNAIIRVATISGNSLTLGAVNNTGVPMSNGQTGKFAAVQYDSNTGSYLVVVVGTSSTYYTWGMNVSVSGTTATVNDGLKVYDSTSTKTICIAHDTSSGIFYVHTNSANATAYYAALKMGASSVSSILSNIIEPVGLTSVSLPTVQQAVYVANAGAILTGSSNKVAYNTFFSSSPMWGMVGIAEQTVSDGASIDVTIIGGENTNLSGLSAGSTYAIDYNNAQIAPSSVTPLYLATTATSAIVIRGGF